jgi:hypothetical protein
MEVLKAGKKPREEKEISDLNFTERVEIKTLSNLAPDTNRKKQVLKNEGDILTILKEEGIIDR